MKIGIVGAGNMGNLHASLLKTRSDVEFMGVTDIDYERCKSFCETHGGRAFRSVAEMVQAGTEVVFVTIPNTKHKEAVVSALKEGATVFCEKPFVTSLQDADEIMNVLGDDENRLYVGFNRRFAPVYAETKQIIQNGFKIYSGNIIMNDGDMTSPPWVTNVELTGGFLYDSTIHMFDMVRYLMGEIREVRCVSQQCLYPLHDNFSCMFTTEEGQSIVLSTNGHASWTWPSERIQLWGDHGTIITEELDLVTECGPLKQEQQTKNVRGIDRNLKWGYVQMHKDFLDSVKHKTTFSVSANDAYRSVLITDACYRSASEGGKLIYV
ncbi:Gfo/Idh/MocA family protein [Gottfriedia sp. NPDC057991]|uniref:Gfo/Idh/MocA family protein n=1 Tax=Gottfriedia sp. NPDC057991 TaxID=3346298 RepID=UPI0036D8A022